ncbi:MAG: hypothetical protein NWE98_02625 [Candidatus Bathyarchaeota archaeon]|nr:hypothetical protein [Candidatus Bathyarchaeota archaeon]
MQLDCSCGEKTSRHMPPHPHRGAFNMNPYCSCGVIILCHTITGAGMNRNPKEQSSSFAVLRQPQNRHTHIKPIAQVPIEVSKKYAIGFLEKRTKNITTTQTSNLPIPNNNLFQRLRGSDFLEQLVRASLKGQITVENRKALSQWNGQPLSVVFVFYLNQR